MARVLQPLRLLSRPCRCRVGIAISWTMLVRCLWAAEPLRFPCSPAVECTGTRDLARALARWLQQGGTRSRAESTCAQCGHWRRPPWPPSHPLRMCVTTHFLSRVLCVDRLTPLAELPMLASSSCGVLTNCIHRCVSTAFVGLSSCIWSWLPTTRWRATRTTSAPILTVKPTGA